MNAQPMFTDNGDGYDITPAGVLLLVADTVYGDPSETTPQGMANAQALMDGILAAARAGGFMQNDILLTLLTLLARKPITRRVAALAQAAVDAAGDDAMQAVFAKARL